MKSAVTHNISLVCWSKQQAAERTVMTRFECLQNERIPVRTSSLYFIDEKVESQSAKSGHRKAG